MMHLVRRESFLVSLFFCSLVLADFWNSGPTIRRSGGPNILFQTRRFRIPDWDPAFLRLIRNQFDCGNGNTVPGSSVCDGYDDCKNGADERTCSNGGFDCGHGRSVIRNFVCDGDDDCGNGKDERNCTPVLGNPRTNPRKTENPASRTAQTSENPTTNPRTTENPVSRTAQISGQFDCGNGNTVPGRYVCDGDDDCNNGADERTCNNGIFVCGNGRSVQRFFVCDGDDDCGNGNDERNCTPENPTTNPRTTENPVSRTAQISGPRFVYGRFFECGNNRYVRQQSLCDGFDDCGNLADERGCIQPTEPARRSRDEGGVKAIILKEEANIQSPGYPMKYPNNVDVLWNVSSAPGYRIKLAFRVKELENSRNCSADRLSLYDGHEVSSPSLGVYCRYQEDQLPNPVVSTSNAMVVQFTSDFVIRKKGFDLVLSTVCGGPLLAQTTEQFLVSHSKFGDGPYGENITCDWIIRSSLERNVLLIFSDFDVGATFRSTDDDLLREKVVVVGCEDSISGDCVQYIVPEENDGKDFVEIYDGPDDYSNLFGRYSGSQIPPSVISRGEELLIRFRSGHSGNFRGFRAMFKQL